MYPKGYFTRKWMSTCLLVFAVIAIPLSIYTNHLSLIGVGPALGLGLGAFIGHGYEKQQIKAGNIRPLTQDEAKRQKYASYGAALIVISAIALFLVLQF